MKNQTSVFHAASRDKELLNHPDMTLKNKLVSLNPTSGFSGYSNIDISYKPGSEISRDKSHDFVNDYFDDVKGLSFFMKLRKKQAKTHNKENSLRGSFGKEETAGILEGMVQEFLRF